MTLPRLCIALFAAAALAPATVFATEPFATAEQAIVSDEVDTEHPAVVGLSRSFLGTCSGTLIAPNLVLTAQHCVANTADTAVVCGNAGFTSRIEPRFMLVTTESQMGFDARYYEGLRLRLPPDTTDLCGYDLALLILKENIPEEEAEYIIPRIDIPVEAGEIYTAIGYGHVGDGSGSGTRRILRDRSVYCVGMDCPAISQTHPYEFIGDNGTCQGDSGGPALDQDGQVVGVVSRGPQGCGNTTYGAVYSWGEWIREVGVEAAELGGYEPPPWVTEGSSDPRLVDADLDGIRDGRDNCVDVSNGDQSDLDGDGVGDACDVPDEPEVEPTPDAGPVEDAASDASDGSGAVTEPRGGGSGCAAGGGGAVSAVWLLALAASRRRRQPRA